MKRWQKRLCIVAGVFVLLCVLGFLLLSRYNIIITVGTGFLVNGQYYMLDDVGPIRLHYRGRANYRSGARILVVHNGVRLSYPGQTDAFLILRLKKGSLADLPPEIIEEFHVVE